MYGHIVNTIESQYPRNTPDPLSMSWMLPQLHHTHILHGVIGPKNRSFWHETTFRDRLWIKEWRFKRLRYLQHFVYLEQNTHTFNFWGVCIKCVSIVNCFRPPYTIIFSLTILYEITYKGRVESTTQVKRLSGLYEMM